MSKGTAHNIYLVKYQFSKIVNSQIIITACNKITFITTVIITRYGIKSVIDIEQAKKLKVAK